MNDDSKIARRKMLKTSVFGSLAGLFLAVNPAKLFSSQKNTERKKLKVFTHPLAIKRNNKDKS